MIALKFFQTMNYLGILKDESSYFFVYSRCSQGLQYGFWMQFLLKKV